RKTFTMYKFRSMVVNDASDTAWSRRCDSRTTRFGALIRKLSIDELPQFFNVLRGDMSVVGPRPELPYYVEQYRHTVPLYMVKHQIKPGITGWAQVNGLRGDTSIEKRIEYDIWYIDNWSIYLDIKIIFKTIFGGLINKEQSLKSAEREEQTV
ncbi:MAG: sugar transferase, partial [Oscillospiraceae bacterium]|nr:sugar transferase [Oscillospiraceae bacterium]